MDIGFFCQLPLCRNDRFPLYELIGVDAFFLLFLTGMGFLATTDRHRLPGRPQPTFIRSSHKGRRRLPVIISSRTIHNSGSRLES